MLDGVGVEIGVVSRGNVPLFVSPSPLFAILSCLLMTLCNQTGYGLQATCYGRRAAGEDLIGAVMVLSCSLHVTHESWGTLAWL